MANKGIRSPQASTEQKKRTAKNQIKKYEKLIEKFPKSKDLTTWQKVIEFFKKA